MSSTPLSEQGEGIFCKVIIGYDKIDYIDVTEDVAELENQNLKVWNQKNYWWRMANHYGNALRKIADRINRESQSDKWTSIDAAIMHELAEMALEYDPDD